MLALPVVCKMSAAGCVGPRTEIGILVLEKIFRGFRGRCHNVLLLSET